MIKETVKVDEVLIYQAFHGGSINGLKSETITPRKVNDVLLFPCYGGVNYPIVAESIDSRMIVTLADV